jgi:hypothetical protein
VKLAVGVAFACAASCCMLGGCMNDPSYFPAPAALEVDGNGMEAKQTLQLFFRTPTASEETARQSLSSQLGYEVPWLREDRVHLELRYTITNLGDTEASFLLNVDGASEFVRFDEDAVAAAFVAADMDAPSPRPSRRPDR